MRGPIARVKELLSQNEELRRRIAELEARLREKEERLKESERRFRITFERANVGMAHVSPEGRWLRVNKKLCEIVGYSREELLGFTFADITHPRDLDVDLGCVRRVLRGEIRAYSMDKRYVKKDGRRIWVRLSVSLVRSDSGEPEYFISVVEDITARKLKELVPGPLTEREQEVLRLMTERETNRRIAEELRYSRAMIKVQLGRILAKLAVKSRAEAALRAVEIGLLDPLPGMEGLTLPEKHPKRITFVSRSDRAPDPSVRGEGISADEQEGERR